MATNLLNVLKEKSKSNSLSTRGVEPVKYNNPIARLNDSKVGQADPNMASTVANSVPNNSYVVPKP